MVLEEEEVAVASAMEEVASEKEAVEVKEACSRNRNCLPLVEGDLAKEVER